MPQVITMPDGQRVSFPDTFTEQQIRGLIAQKYPREVGEFGASKMPEDRDTSGHFEFDGSGIEGYDPATGEMRGPEATNPRFTSSLLGAIEGLPIVGHHARQGVEAGASGIGAMVSGRPYADVREEVGGMVSGAIEDHPNYNAAGKVAGGVAGILPAVMAAPAAFGAGTGGLMARSVASAISGGTIGGADAAIRSGGDPEAALRGAGWGAGLGLVGPAIGSAVGAGVRKVAERAGPTVSRAQQAFGRATGADAIDDIPARLAQMGPDAMPMDLGTNLQGQAGALAATPGRGKEIVRSAVRGRDAGANQRIKAGIDDAIGPAPVPSRVEADIVANMEALRPEYTAVFRNARRVDTEPIANHLDSQIVNLRGDAQKAVTQVRRMLNVVGTDELDPNPYTLFQTRQAIDGMLETEANTKVIGALSEARRLVDNRLAGSVPGIKLVDAKHAELARQRAALTRGQQVLDSGRTSPRPVELADEVQQGALPQGEMVGPSAVPLRLRQGTRAEIDRVVGTNANDRVAMQKIIKGEGDWNRDKLVTQFGQERADRLLSLLETERAFAEISNTVTRNSESAARLAAMADTGAGAKQPGFFKNAMNWRFGDAAADVGDKALGSLKGEALEQANEELARLLTSRDPQMITRAIRMVQDAARRGDISAQRAKELVQGFSLSGVQERMPLELTVTR